MLKERIARRVKNSIDIMPKDTKDHFAFNRSAGFDYDIREKFSAGLLLSGHEAKSIRRGHLDLSGSYGIIRGGEIFAIGLKIPSFQPKNTPPDYASDRVRKLLFNKKEIAYLSGQMKAGLRLVPLRVFEAHHRLKLELGLGRSRKKKDKREVIKKREIEREIRATKRRP